MKTFHELMQTDDQTWVEMMLVQAVATLSTQPAFSAMVPEDVYETVRRYAFPVPSVVFFFDNGTTMVGAPDGKQMPRYQGPHQHAIDRLKQDGIELTQIAEIFGSPTTPVKWIRPTEIDMIPEQFRSEGKPWTTPDPETELAVTKARSSGRCRVCGMLISGAGSPAGWEHEFGERIYPDAVTLNFGAEFAHTACLPPKPEGQGGDPRVRDTITGRPLGPLGD